MSEVNIATLVKKARINKNMSARELAKLCDISHAEINNIEKGKRVKPALLILKGFEKYLDLDFKEIAKLVGYSDETIEHYDENIIVSYEKYDQKVKEYENEMMIIKHKLDAKRHLGMDIKEKFEYIDKYITEQEKIDEDILKELKNINKLLDMVIE